MNGMSPTNNKVYSLETSLEPLNVTSSSENRRINRHMQIEKILSNEYDGKFKVSSIGYCVLSVAFCLLATILLTSWPQHQSIGQSKYWWESVLLDVSGQAFFASKILVFTSYFSLGIGLMETYKTCFVAWFFGALAMFISAYHILVFWVYVGGYEWPMPFQGYIVMCVGWWVIIASFWFHSKMRWKSDGSVTRKILWAIIFINVSYLGVMTYQGVQVLFVLVDETYHWPLVLLILLLREFQVRLFSYIGKKINKSEDLAVEIDAVVLAAIRHILFLSVNLGSMTTANVSYAILAADFTINLGDCLAIIWYHKKGDEASKKKKMHALITLIANETTEFILPISYVSVLLLSYYGPNAEIMGNIKNSSWQYAAIENIDDTIFWLGVMFLVDSASTVISFLLLWVFCKVNIIKMYSHILQHMGYLLAVQPAYYISEVFLISFYIYKKHFNILQNIMAYFKYI